MTTSGAWRRFVGAAAAAAGIATGAELLQPLVALAGDPGRSAEADPGRGAAFWPGHPDLPRFPRPNTEVASFNEMSTITGGAFGFV